MFYIGYVNFVIILFTTTGILILLFDVKGYKLANMKKEKKSALVLGWINTVLGIAVFITNWLINKFYW